MKKIVIIAMGLVLSSTALAQEKVETTVCGDFVSSYIWRGQDLGSAAVQPTLGVTYKGLSLTAWGSYGLTNPDDVKEFDLTLGYSVGEATVGYDFGPVALAWYTNIAGNDGENKDGKRAYSSYVEANVPFSLAGIDWKATAGVVPYATTLYGTTGFAVTNLSLRATKEIKVTDTFSIPVFGQVTGNPCSQKAYLVFGLTLQP